jgi:hypothetical protein
MSKEHYAANLAEARGNLLVGGVNEIANDALVGERCECFDCYSCACAQVLREHIIATRVAQQERANDTRLNPHITLENQR